MTTGPMQFYFSPGSCSLATALALEHAGADYAMQRVNFGAAEQRSESYLSINPKGRVPALAVGDTVLTENPAILLFLAQAHPDSGLAPVDDPLALAKANSFNLYLCSTVHVAHAHKGRGSRWADDEVAWDSMKRKVPESMTSVFRLIEEDFLVGPWVLGDELSMCDYYLFTLARWLDGDGVDLTKLPRVMDHRERMMQRPLVERMVARHEHPAKPGVC
jgi:glutathione S-transferase